MLIIVLFLICTEPAFHRLFDAASESVATEHLDASYNMMVAQSNGSRRQETVNEADMIFDLEVNDPIAGRIRDGAMEESYLGGHGSEREPSEDESDVVFDMNAERHRGWNEHHVGRASVNSRLLDLNEEDNSSFEQGAFAMGSGHVLTGNSPQGRIVQPHFVQPGLGRRHNASSLSSAVAIPMPSSAPPVTTFVHAFSIGSPGHLMESISPHEPQYIEGSARPAVAGSLLSISSLAATLSRTYASGPTTTSAMNSHGPATSPSTTRQPALASVHSASGLPSSLFMQPLLSAGSPPVQSSVLQGDGVSTDSDDENDNENDADESESDSFRSCSGSTTSLPLLRSAVRYRTGRRGPFQEVHGAHRTYHHRNSRERPAVAPAHRSSSSPFSNSGISTNSSPIPIPAATNSLQRHHHIPGQLHPHHPQHSRYYEQTEQERVRRPSSSATSSTSAAPSTAFPQPRQRSSGRHLPRQRSSQYQPGHHQRQSSWSANMVLSTSETMDLDPWEMCYADQGG